MLTAAGLALLFPVMQYALDLPALRHMTQTAFGTLMALEPAVGVLLGLLLLSQQLAGPGPRGLPVRVTEVPLTGLPELGDAPAAHLLGAYTSWLAGRGSGLVQIHDPRSFQGAGWWLAVIDGSDSPRADGPQRQVALLPFATPPGVVLSPRTPPCSDEPPPTSASAAPTSSPLSTLPCHSPRRSPDCAAPSS